MWDRLQRRKGKRPQGEEKKRKKETERNATSLGKSRLARGKNIKVSGAQCMLAFHKQSLRVGECPRRET